MATWIGDDHGSGFTLDFLPYGIFSTDNLDARIGVAIGEYILDMKALTQERVFASIEFDHSTLEASTLNSYAAAGRKIHQGVRRLLLELLSEDTTLGPELRDNQDRKERVLVKMVGATMHLPMSIGDYTDFFVGPYHALNCTDIFRPGAGLPPNYLSLPVGYHGRASSIVVSGTPVRRPKGQFVVNETPTFGPCQNLDFEVEFAAFISQGNNMGSSIDVDEAENYIFGFVLMNDWSARDIQIWESTPLGPFNGKNFATTISPWIVPLEALEQFREKPVKLVSQSASNGLNRLTFLWTGQRLPYLDEKRECSVYNIPIHVSLEDESGKYDMFKCNTKNVLFSFAQLLAHHTAGGCPMRTGDLIATGTLSGTSRHELGCLLEASRNGIESYEMETIGPERQKTSRSFLKDGDIIEFRALGFGSCVGQVAPSV